MQKHWLVAPQTFKGTISAKEAAKAIAEGIIQAHPQDEVLLFPIADGGDGTLELLLNFFKGIRIETSVTGPTGEAVKASWGLVDNGTLAIIEMAQVCGFHQTSSFNPLNATTYGVGEIIFEALNRGVRRFILALGGTVTQDGGIGILQALGASFQDNEGKELSPGGGSLIQLQHINLANLDPRLKESSFKIMCDVQTTLEKSAEVYAPQKGADATATILLTQGLQHLAKVINQPILTLSGGGAAGGVAAIFKAIFKTELVSGADFFLDLLEFDKILAKADYVVIGEGQLDEQTLANKGPWAVAQRAQKRHIPVYAVVGKIKKGFHLPKDAGIFQVVTLAGNQHNIKVNLRDAAKKFYLG